MAALQESDAGQDREVTGFPDGWLTAGSIELSSRSLRSIPTPGHTVGHLVFHDTAAATLFAGDHVLPHITPSMGWRRSRAPCPWSIT
jgi:glyoxylase-like metal-dependent hydrolase (beta-lactamase superfamily II)